MGREHDRPTGRRVISAPACRGDQGERVVKAVHEILNSAPRNEGTPAWRYDEYGLVIAVRDIEVRIEPLLFGGAYLAVYEMTGGEPTLVGEKMPITLGTPAQNGYIK